MYFHAEHDSISPEEDVLNDVYREECSVTLKSFIHICFSEEGEKG